MKNGAFCLLALCLVLAGTGASPAREPPLTLETRIAAQTAIARIKHAHQIGSSRPFSQAFPGSLAEGTVRAYLRKSVALDRFWKRPVTRHMLRREIDRLIRGTRMPGRLDELFAALGYDRLLIEECLARPLLVDRLTRNYFAFDQSIHADARSAIEAIRRDLLSGAIDPHAGHPGRAVAELRRVDPARRSDAAEDRLRRLRSGPGARLEIDLQPDEFAARIARLPSSAGAIGAIEEERDRFVLPVVLAREIDSVEVARYTIAKRPWHDWWREVEGELDDGIATTAMAQTVDPALPVDGCAPPVGAVADASDCDDGDPDSWGTPSEVNDVMFQSEVTLIWAPPSAPGSSLPQYDVIRSGDPSDFVSGASCVATDVAANTSDDITIPAKGSAFIYLSRAESDCPAGGSGSLGIDSSGMPRTGRACP